MDFPAARSKDQMCTSLLWISLLISWEQLLTQNHAYQLLLVLVCCSDLFLEKNHLFTQHLPLWTPAVSSLPFLPPGSKHPVSTMENSQATIQCHHNLFCSPIQNKLLLSITYTAFDIML